MLLLKTCCVFFVIKVVLSYNLPADISKTNLINSEHSDTLRDSNINSTTYVDVINTCFEQLDVLKCFKKQIIVLLDSYIKSNASWILNDYIQINKNNNFKDENISIDIMRSINNENEDLDKMLNKKLYNLAESRFVELSFPRLEKLGINDNVEEFGDDENLEEGRHKKKKGGMMMVSGFALAAVVAQLFLGKVAFLAGAAILIAKIALVLSLLSTFKKSSSGSSSGEHVVLATEQHGTNGWQRSIYQPNKDMPYQSQLPQPIEDIY